MNLPTPTPARTCPRCIRRQDEYRASDSPCWHCGWPETPDRAPLAVEGARLFEQTMREDWSMP